MPINYPGVPNIHFTQDETGMPDLGAALRSGFKTFGSGIEAAYKPKQLAEELLQSKLANQINSAKAKYAEQNEQAMLQGRQGLNGLIPFRQQLLQAQTNRAQNLANQPVLNPYDKAAYAAQAKENVKNVSELEQHIPEAQELNEKIRQAIPIIKKHPEWFGPGLLGYDIQGPSYRARNIHDPEFGKVQALFGQLVGPQAQALSGNRILATALNLAQGIKPGFEQNVEPVTGKLEQILNESTKRLNESKTRYKQAGGRRDFGSKLESFTEKDIEDTAKQTGLSITKVKELLKKEGHL